MNAIPLWYSAKCSVLHALAMCLLAAGVAFVAGCDEKSPGEQTAAAAAAAPVTVSVPIERAVQDYEDFTGQTVAKDSVEIRSRVTGYLDKIGFKDGDEIEKDQVEKQVLFVIDQRPFKAAHDNAVAQVALNKANRAFREAEFKRNEQLLKTQAVSQSDYDQSAAQFQQAIASVAAAEANEESAKLNLDFTEIRSRIAGRISKSTIAVGNLVVADQTVLTTVVSLDPMRVEFNADDRRLLQIQQGIREGKIKVKDRDKISVEMGLDNETGFPHQGELDFADNQIDKTTGTILLRAVFDNPQPARGQRVLVPGLHARVRVPIGEPHKVMLVADEAVGSDMGQKYVLVVGDDKKVLMRRVKTGKMESGLRVIEEGLKGGEIIVVKGIQRARPGTVVAPGKPIDMESLATAAPQGLSDQKSASPAAKPAATTDKPAATETPAAAPPKSPEPAK